jgi:hypothetical protein
VVNLQNGPYDAPPGLLALCNLAKHVLKNPAIVAFGVKIYQDSAANQA